MRSLLTTVFSFILATGLMPAAAFAAPAAPETSVAAAESADIDAPEASETPVAPDDPGAVDPDDPADPDNPDIDAPDPVDPDAPVVTATVSDDEKIVKITATGGEFRDAAAVSFKVWPDRSGEQSAIEYGAKRQEDGTWLATTFIAPDSPLSPGLPYNGHVPNAVFRLYNAANGLHMVTTDTNETDHLTRAGWTYEGVSWITPSASSPTAVKVYRAYNPSTYEHHYTTDQNEYNVITSRGWQAEGTSFTSDPTAGVKVYRLFNPVEDKHHYTIDENEYRVLPQHGWRQEGVAFCGDVINADGSWSVTSRGRSHCTAGDYTVEAFVTPATEVTDPEVTDPEATDPEVTDPEATDPEAPASEVRATDEAAPDEGAESETEGEPGTEAAPEPDDDPTDAPTPTPPEPVRVADTAFSISSPTFAVALGTIDNAGGRFEIVVSQIKSVSGVGKIEAPTWNRNGDRSDLRWYQATPAANGIYRATIDARNHNLALAYHTDVYLTAQNGVRAGLQGPDCNLTLANFIQATGGPYTYYVRLYNPGSVSSVIAYVWSEQDGQDDIMTCYAADEGNGWWSATVNTFNLRHPGTVIAHVYADNTLRNAVSFTVQPWEIVEPQYVAMNQRVNDLASPTQYLLAVDTWNCFVGVFEGSRGNWHSIAYWPCTPGASWSPTVKGIYSVQEKGYVFGHGYSCYYYTQFFGDYLFHSILYNPGTFNVQDGTMGVPASHGCVRLWIENAKWIYDNIPRGTTVLTY